MPMKQDTFVCNRSQLREKRPPIIFIFFFNYTISDVCLNCCFDFKCIITVKEIGDNQIEFGLNFP